MDIITLQGYLLDCLLDEIRNDQPIRTLRVARDVDGVKVKINEGVWSPGYPLADEDARRLGRTS